MGRKLQRGKAGNVAKYITRTRAVKRLQLRLAEFRRLCILKGIYPREPKKKVHGQNKTYYHLKDINFLAHEPLLEKFRAITAHERKVRRARVRANRDLAKALAARAPSYKLDHLVRERYPSFLDALRDIDDALSMVHLFATLPASETHAIPPAVLHTSRRLVLEWQAWCCRTHAVRKAFISVKGFYMQAEVEGQAVTWLMPHSTAQVLPPDVDYRVMLTFLEFHHTLLQFVLFKLYHGLGLRYPPKVNSEMERASAELAGIIAELSGAQHEAQQARESAAAAADSPLLLTAGGGGKADGAAAAAGATAAAARDGAGRLSGDVSGSDAGGSRRSRKSSAVEEEAGTDEGVEEGDDSEVELEVDSGDDDLETSADEEDSGDEGSGEGDDDADDETQFHLDQILRMQPAAADSSGDAGGDAAPAGPVSDAVAAAGGATTGVATDADVCAKLFSGTVVWLSREVPREVLMLIVRAFGGVAAWDGPGSPYAEADERVTHAVVDRPQQVHRRSGRVYVQPQWLFDCANFRVIVSAEGYAPGRPPPPHLSPFESYGEGDYVPEAAARLRRLQEAADAVRAGVAEGPDGEMVGGAAAGADGAGEENEEDVAARKAEADELRFVEELQTEMGASAAGVGVKRRAPEAEGADDSLTDNQKKAFMTRKQRKMFEGARKREGAKADRVAKLQAKKDALKTA
eukprot:jgi/Ulvmu1/9893/UM057_0050.1